MDFGLAVFLGLIVIAGTVATIVSVRNTPRMPPPGALLVLFLLAFASIAGAQDATPTPEAPSQFHVSLQSWAMSLFKPGEDRHLLVGARGFAHYKISSRLKFDGRLDASAISDGGAVTVHLDDPSSFTSLEAYADVRFEIVNGLHVIAVYGYVLPTEGGKLQILERNPQVMGGGLELGDSSGRWMMIAFGRDDAAGRGLRVLISGEFPLDGRVSAVVDGAIGGAGTFVRTGVAVRVGAQ